MPPAFNLSQDQTLQLIFVAKPVLIMTDEQRLQMKVRPGLNPAYSGAGLDMTAPENRSSHVARRPARPAGLGSHPNNWNNSRGHSNSHKDATLARCCETTGTCLATPRQQHVSAVNAGHILAAHPTVHLSKIVPPDAASPRVVRCSPFRQGRIS